MSLTKLLYPAALILLLFSIAQAVAAVRLRSRARLLSAVTGFALLAVGASVLMEFLTRPF